ncbi:MAG: VWA domain-containing protein [Polyangiaceae bacterium]|nr:VWA domain-containing protein [Polyangiaceae bacterium]
MLYRLVVAWTLALSVLVGFGSEAWAVPLTIDGSLAGPASCPDGGVAVDRTCTVNATASQNVGCRYGGEHVFDSISLTNNAFLCVTTFNGLDKQNSGNVVLKSLSSIVVDATSRITAKGRGYQGLVCDDGPGPTAAAGGKGGCSVNDSGGGGAHFGAGGRGTKDCFIVAPATSCQFPQEWEEDCGAKVGNACVAMPDPLHPVCYGTTNTPDGAGDANPSVAGQAFTHSVFQSEFGAAGGDKGCRDGFDAAPRAGHGGGRVVLFAANAAQTGAISIAGRISADGNRGCSSGNDSAGGGAGGSILIVGDVVNVLPTARISAHGGRGGDSQPKCLPCTTSAQCQAGQTCQAGRCGPCNCTPCTSNAQCDALLGQTCKNLGGDLGNVCANAANQCTPFDPGDDERECSGTQNNGTCDDCGGGGGGGIINIQSRASDIPPEAIFDVRGAGFGGCSSGSGSAGGGAGELQIDGGYNGEVCDGWDNDFNSTADDGLLPLLCPDGSTPPSCAGGEPSICDYSDPSLCLVPSADARPRFTLIVDTSGSMLNDLVGYPTFGDGSVDHPGIDTASDADAIAGNNSRLFIAKDALSDVISAFPESDYALARYYQDVGANRSCQTASNFECASSCCSYDDPTNNLPPLYPSTYPGNTCVLSQIYPGAGYPNTSDFTSNIEIEWAPEGMEDPPTSDCINYAGSCGPPRRGAQVVVGFDENINRYLSWLDGTEDTDATFNAGTIEGNHCPNGDCELRGTGPTPLGGALEATYDYLTPVISCDSAKACRSYSTILLTDGAESCEGDPVGAAAALSSGISGKQVQTYVIGFSVLASEQAQLNAIASAGGTGSAFFVSTKEELANALATIIGQNQVFELCNGLDDDCDTLVDEDFPELGLPCTDGELGVCMGTGQLECNADGSGTECVITNPGQMPGTEICNSLDDDCDGMVDEDDMGLPLPCPTCVPSPEICDGVDNDCDFAVDEEADVEMNQPGIYGVPCQEPVAPNDQPPCQAGTVICINAGPLCFGAVGPKQEICNGLDDDCDGVGDDFAECPGRTQCIEGTCVTPCEAGEFPCAPGFACTDGFCFPITCDDIECPPGATCEDGVCIGGEGGAGGQGAGQTSTTTSGQGGAPPTTSSSGDGAADGGFDPDANFGLATGGGGCNTSGGSGAAWLALALVGLLGARGRRGRDGEVRR